MDNTASITIKRRDDADYLARLGTITVEDLIGDVERLIHATVVLYVDASNVLLHEDEMRAECRAKLARVIDGGHLLRCSTRAKAFAFIKTAMRNHVRSVVQKIAFAQRRTGIKHPLKRLRMKHGQGSGHPKLTKVSLDDGDYSLHIGSMDSGFRRLEFLEELDSRLTQEERQVFTFMLAGGDEDAEPRLKVVVAKIKKKARAVVAGAV